LNIRIFLAVTTSIWVSLLLCTGGNAFSQPFPVPFSTQNPTSVVGNGTAQSCTEAALRAALEKGGVVSCECGPTPVTITLTSPILLKKDTYFDGDGNTLSGGGTTRILEKFTAPNQAAGLTLALQNVTLSNAAVSSRGAAVFNNTFGRFSAYNATFSSNRCTSAGPDSGGAALYSLLQRDVLLVKCNFTDNQASNGGAIGGVGNSMRIEESLFENNRATGSGGGADQGPTGQGGIGGAIYIDNVDKNGTNNYLTILKTTFRNNRSNAHAGALFSYTRPDKGSIVTIDHCLFENNSEAVNQAGALYHQNNTLRLSNTTFSANSAPTQGGALWVYGANVDIVNSTFEANCAGTLGGALCFSSNNTATLRHLTIANNSANVFASALYIAANTTLMLKNSLLYNNHPGSGPQLNIYGGMGINKGSSLVDSGGNFQFPASFTVNNTTRLDDWLSEHPGVRRENMQLQPLANNGGFTPTMALASGSPAINAGSGNCLPSDQRGALRVGPCDAGAYEFGSTVLPSQRSTAISARIFGKKSHLPVVTLCGRKLGGSTSATPVVERSESGKKQRIIIPIRD
jgi:hypothetical protein